MAELFALLGLLPEQVLNDLFCQSISSKGWSARSPGVTQALDEGHCIICQFLLWVDVLAFKPQGLYFLSFPHERLSFLSNLFLSLFPKWS